MTAAHLLMKLGRSLGYASTEKHPPKSLEELVLEKFYHEEVGKAFGVGRDKKAELVERFKTSTSEIPSGTAWLYHVILAQEILSVPPDVLGDVIECGCWKGASTASLSHVCRLVGRKLIVCDSFEGLPDDDVNIPHQYPHVKVYGFYQKGMYAGRLDEVKANVERFGEISVCQFVPGFFSDTLVALTGPIAFAFIDVDLASSTRDCLKYIWPLLIDGGAVFTDDSCDMEVVRVWFDEEWWRREIGERAPGYIGSGCGLPIDPNFSSLGYARKLGKVEQVYNRVPWLYYPDAPAEGPYFSKEKNP
ncbi:MAG: TylF/MycF/NovP-related O-methyltransferase [Pyrinomonadaceae bacterium]